MDWSGGSRTLHEVRLGVLAAEAVLMALIPWLVAAYAGICAAAYFGNRLLMCIPDPARITPAEVS